MQAIKRYWPVAVSLMILAGLATFVISNKRQNTQSEEMSFFSMGTVLPKKTCSRPPRFLRNMRIAQPVMIDLSQKRYKGMALLYGKDFSKVLHPKQWEQYEHFSTYALDDQGNIYLIPIPFISIHPTTFNLQRKIYRLDTDTGRISIFMEMEDVIPTPQNPYGLSAIAWDCDSRTFWVAAIDESDYTTARGVIYRIDPETKKVLQRIEGFDALTLQIVHTVEGKYLLAGSARDNGLYAFAFQANTLNGKAEKVLEMPDPNEHIRKIKVLGRDRLSIETIPFTYSLIAQSAREDRAHYEAAWLSDRKQWIISKREKLF